MPHVSAARPHPASTVIVLRPRPRRARGFETYLVQRASGASFWPGAHVFPGGRVDAHDAMLAWTDRVEGLPALEARAAGERREALLPHAIAAIRELFEEAGLLLARPTAGGEWDRTPEAERGARLAHHRRAMCDGLRLFAEVCAELGCRLALDELAPWARWITPDVEPRRFDTWFFLAMAPAHQIPSAHAGETAGGRWLTPADALDRFAAGDLSLAPPTLRTLEELAVFARAEDVFRAAPARSLAPVLPRLVEDGGRPCLVLPGDPAYGTDDPPIVAGPTRFVHDGRAWRSAPAGAVPRPG
jgi:8-oxo-dGTP pyrophosphatase MutT (NUDIX family)